MTSFSTTAESGNGKTSTPSCERSPANSNCVRNPDPAQPEAIHQALLSGLLSHLGHKDPDSFEYRGARGSRFAINPGSSLFKQAPEWVMAAELVETTRLWARGVAALDPEWVEEVGSHLINRTHSDPWWEADRGAAVAHETVTIYGLPLQTTRIALYSGVDPAGAREMFILNALVAGDWEADHAFVAHNREKVQEVLGMEARARRTDLLVDDRTVFEFFDTRIPPDITSTRHFDSWWKKQRPANPQLLDLSVTDLIDPEADSARRRCLPGGVAARRPDDSARVRVRRRQPHRWSLGGDSCCRSRAHRPCRIRMAHPGTA